MATKQSGSKAGAAWRTLGTGVGFTAIVVILLLWLAGVFQPKVNGATAAVAVSSGRPLGGRATAPARLVTLPATEAAVGSIRAVHESAVAAKLLAKVVEVNVQAGQVVRAGDVLLRLDDEDLQARLRQAEAALAAAQAARRQSEIEFQRLDGLYKQEHATKLEWERAQTELETATAGVERAVQAAREAETILSYATIRSPLDGIIVDKRVEVGDTATPGQVLLTLYDPTRMQLIARVRESLTQRLQVGQDIDVYVSALGKTCIGRVSEIVPEAEAASRTFSVKVTGPCPEGVYTGMFGRLLIPLDDEQVLVIPQAAVRRIGQLDVVDVVVPGPDEAQAEPRVQRRTVQLGRDFGADVEVLAGLQAGELVALGTGAAAVP
jgi:RND family efflux transporter MFP subunit